MLRRSRAVLVVVVLVAGADWGPASADEQRLDQNDFVAKCRIIERIGKGFVVGEELPHDGFPALEKGLSKAEQLENFDILWEAIDRHYSFFDLKKIDWQKVENRYHFRVKAATGDDYYTKPVALLTNAVTGSASDLFACMMRGTGRVITVGTTTHGDLPGFSVVAVLPCGLVVRISSAYVADNDGRPIEVDGNVPQVHAELTVKDVMKGTDSVIVRAVQALRAAPLRAAPDGERPAGSGDLSRQSSAMFDANRAVLSQAGDGR
jgi:hypothetical protein